ncbi:HlyD family secretion protein [Serratia nevei]|uniref:HlyD family secretion protein n=1 Tax=Serratia TaxID=613 RepID=UPI00217ADF40|nr:HlyD family secretion protein [Serratia marcescens]CAI1750210.1 Probable efflux pump periplasmic linker ttgA precursor [Serratia marcescens]
MASKKVAVAVLAVTVITLGLLINKFFIKETQQNTNDAYIRADISRISPQIAGEIAQVLVRDNQWVKQGELLAVIDPREFNVALAQAEATLKAARNMEQVLQAKLADSDAELMLAQAKKAMAELNLSYTRITAPIGGVVGKKSLRVGEFVKPGDALLAIVPQDKLYIIANYQETQLENIAHGQSVDIHIDTFPGQTLKGQVDSIAPASGVSFAAVAPENATGNFTKIVQRIPVKIVFDSNKEHAALLSALRVGMSADVSINTLDGGLQ